MNEKGKSHTRRAVVATTVTGAGAAMVLAGGFLPAAAVAGQSEGAQELAPMGALSDWDFLVGSWSVRHRRLKGRLVGSTEWQEFDGTCVNWKTMGGYGNVDDNVLELPSGTYQAVGIRAFNPDTRQWSIWWLDSRAANIEPPVRGGFEDGVGIFIGDDVHDGRPVKVRFRWTKITSSTAHWDQAFSTDGGATWEENWHMDFTRVVAGKAVS
ncbi:DUF1579 domain-containing protein [Sphingopyxis sp.]|jgi:hypothetical protein|uniref:DUF1579 domain-containing protein n=1 Tax=Sphingopyxis sp. TaxID=1908224 RepID=UPI003F712A9A